MTTIVKAAVVGAGVMGAGIAAHLANAGLKVVLLDINIEAARRGVQNQLKAGGFMLPAFADRITPGSIAEDLSLLSDADWIIEAVVEDLHIKQALYRSLDTVRKAGSIVSSNTSTIPLKVLTQSLPENFAADFLIAHFFNPPRIMRLLEIVAGTTTKPENVKAIAEFADRKLGKGVVFCKDTPGFIGNRVGNYWMAAAQNEAIARELDIEVADALIGKPFGIPSTGIFGLLDLVGIDLMATLLHGLQAALPFSDPIQNYPAKPALIATMIAENRLGRKSGAGFVRIGPDKQREVIDLASGLYRPQRALDPETLALAKLDPKSLFMQPGLAGDYVGTVMGKTFAYAASLIPEIADTPAAIDSAMRLGYGWQAGPFELMDRIGVADVAEMLARENISVPPYLALAAASGGYYKTDKGQISSLLPDGTQASTSQDDAIISLARVRSTNAPIAVSPAANLWDIGDGVACLELRTKMNTITPAVLDFIGVALEQTSRDFRALVIGSDAIAFSAGADLREFQSISDHGGAVAIGSLIDAGQNAFQSIKYAPFPVVGAASGLALGGGCELLLHCDSVQAHAELSMGLVETLVGLIPGWGGCAQMLERLCVRDGDRLSASAAVYQLIASATVSTSAFHARELGFLRADDGITMNRDRLIADAKAKALQLVDGYRPPARYTIPALDLPYGTVLTEGLGVDVHDPALSAHDHLIRQALMGVLGKVDAAGGALDEAQILAGEQAAFVELLGSDASLARIGHMLATGKALRN